MQFAQLVSGTASSHLASGGTGSPAACEELIEGGVLLLRRLRFGADAGAAGLSSGSVRLRGGGVAGGASGAALAAGDMPDLGGGKSLRPISCPCHTLAAATSTPSIGGS